LTKTEYFNTGCVFLRCKIQINIKQNLVEKYAEELQIFENIFFEIFFLDRARPDPLILGWAGHVNRNQQWRTLYCSREQWRLFDAGEQKEDGGGEGRGKADPVAALPVEMLVLLLIRMAVP
jgi:hypothetical protein